jgi:hypothetical protein
MRSAPTDAMLRSPSLLAAPLLLASTLLAAPAAAQLAEPEPPWTPRFRGGAGFVAGLSAPGPLLGLGIQGRLGVQLDDRWALFAEPEFFYGASLGSRSGSLLCGALSPEIELTFADRFSLAAGPTLVVGAFAPTSGDPSFAPMPGGKLRLGLGFGSKTATRRHQFTIAIEPRVLVSPESGPAGFFTLALGYDAK